MKRFKVIDGDDDPQEFRRRKDAELLVCPCGSSEFIVTVTNPMIDGNDVVSEGVKQYRCYHCGRVAL